MEVFILTDRKSGSPVEVYMGVRSHNQKTFDSVSDARTSNCNGIYADRVKYAVAKYKLVEIDADVDPASPTEIAKAAHDALEKQKIEAEMDALGIIHTEARATYAFRKGMADLIFGLLADKGGISSQGEP